MIDHFFAIKKEKQDRILNAVLKAFALYGYKRASTDEMVREASISKGLLFHYFTSKAGLYEFVYSYSVKYMSMELTSLLAGKETDYFVIRRQIEEIRYKVLKSFPYMPLFLAQAAYESEQRTEEVLRCRAEYTNLLHSIENKAEFLGYPAHLEPDKLFRMTDYILEGIMREAYAKGTPQTDEVYEQAAAYLSMLQRMCQF